MRHLAAAPALALIAAACTASQTTAPAAAPTGETLRIAAWNIEHLSAENGSGCRPREDADYDRVAAYIDQTGADVWMLQEIDGEAALARVFDPDEWTFHVEDRPAPAPGSPCGRNSDNTWGHLATAVVLRNGIEHERLDDLAALDVSNGYLRHGVHVRLTGGEPLDLLSIHLKASCPGGNSGDDCETLFEQIPILEAWLDDLGEEGRAVLVGGDFNRRLENPGDPVWADLDDGDPVDLEIAGAGTGPECNPRYDQFIDFLVLNEYAAGMQVEGSFRETTFRETGEDRPSDHCPVAVDVRR